LKYQFHAGREVRSFRDMSESEDSIHRRDEDA